MEAPQAASPPALRLRAAAASPGRRDRVASWAADAVVRVFFVAVCMGAITIVIPSIAALWIGGAAGSTVKWLGAVAFKVSWWGVRYIPVPAVLLYLLRSFRKAPVDAEGKEGASSIVKEASTMEHRPKSKVEWHQLVKDLNVTPAGIFQTIFMFFLISGYWMKNGTENGPGKQKIGAVLHDIGLFGASIIS